MNNKIKMQIAIVLDASGSMNSRRQDTIEMLKKFFASTTEEGASTKVDVWQFNEKVKHIVDDEDPTIGAAETLESYEPDGCTALYDAICIGIDELGKKLAWLPEDERPDGVMFAILTDGFENASKKYTIEDVKDRIKHQSEKYKWDFQFLAANQDAIISGGLLGIEMSGCQRMKMQCREEYISDTHCRLVKNYKKSCAKASRKKLFGIF